MLVTFVSSSIISNMRIGWYVYLKFNVSKTRNETHTEIKDDSRFCAGAKEFNVLIDCLCDAIKMRARLKHQIKPIT